VLSCSQAQATLVLHSCNLYYTLPKQQLPPPPSAKVTEQMGPSWRWVVLFRVEVEKESISFRLQGDFREADRNHPCWHEIFNSGF